MKNSQIVISIKSIFIGMMLITHAYAEQVLDNPPAQFSDSVIINYDGDKFYLNLTGLTIRKKLFLKIYSMTHYIEKNTDVLGSNVSEKDIYNSVLQHRGAKQISMVFMRSLSATQIKNSLLSGIKSNSDEDEFQQIRPSVEEFTRTISADVKENDQFVLRWLPNGTLVSLFQGQQISAIKDKQFAKVIWSIWFSDKSIVKRERLIEKLLASS